MVGKKGIEGSVVSNRSRGAKVELAKTLLLTSFNLSESEALSIRRKVSVISTNAIEEIDK